MDNFAHNYKRNFYLSGDRKKYWYSAFFLGFFVALILIGFEPYETSITDQPDITFVRIGVGLICTVVYIIGYEILLKWFKNMKFTYLKLIFFDVLLALMSIVLIFLYDRYIVVKDGYVTLGFLLEYILILALPFYPIILFIFHFLKTAVFPIQIYLPITKEHFVEQENVLYFKEDNESVRFSTNLNQLLYIQSQDNYIEIYYLKDGDFTKHLMRGTLKKVLNDFSFLLKVHRSFVVNPYKVECIVGNSNKATISFKDVAVSIPVSKSFYSSVKNHLSTNTKN